MTDFLIFHYLVNIKSVINNLSKRNTFSFCLKLIGDQYFNENTSRLFACEYQSRLQN